MKELKGLVLEIKNNKIIVLTPDGRFLEKKITDNIPGIGCEVDLNTFQTKRNSWLMLGVAAVFALIFIPLLALQLFIYPQIPVAYITIDINPSIELGLNKYDQVISTSGLNQDGIDLLNKMKLNNLTVEQALEIVTEEAIKEKYINADKENAVIISYSSKKPVKNISTQISSQPEALIAKQEILESKVKQVIERNQQDAIVEIVHVSPKVRNEAGELGLSTGKYTLLLEAWNEGLEISPESIKVNNIISALEEEGINPGQFISQVQKRNYSITELENLTFKYETKLKELKTKEKIATNKLEKENLKKEAIKSNKENKKSNGVDNNYKATSTNIQNGISSDKSHTKQSNKQKNNEIQRDNENEKQSITELEKEIKKESNSGEDNKSVMQDKDNGREKDKEKDRNKNKDKDKENKNNKNDKNDNDRPKEKDKSGTLDEEINQSDYQESLNTIENNEQSKSGNKDSNLTKTPKKYQGHDRREMPESIRLMLLELLKNRNR